MLVMKWEMGEGESESILPKGCYPPLGEHPKPTSRHRWSQDKSNAGKHDHDNPILVLLWQGRQYIIPEQDEPSISEKEKEEDDEENDEDDEEEEEFSRIVYEEKYHDDREDDFLNGKVMMIIMTTIMMLMMIKITILMIIMMTERVKGLKGWRGLAVGGWGAVRGRLRLPGLTNIFEEPRNISSSLSKYFLKF